MWKLIRHFIVSRGRENDPPFTHKDFEGTAWISRDRTVFENLGRGSTAEAAVQDAQYSFGFGLFE